MRYDRDLGLKLLCYVWDNILRNTDTHLYSVKKVTFKDEVSYFRNFAETKKINVTKVLRYDV